MTFFPLYLRKRLKPRGKFAKTFFFFRKRLNFAENRRHFVRRPFLFFLKGGVAWENFFGTFFFGEHLPLGLGLEHSCSWPREIGPWSRRLCLRLHLCFEFFSLSCYSIPQLFIPSPFISFILLTFFLPHSSSLVFRTPSLKDSHKLDVSTSTKYFSALFSSLGFFF